MYSNGNYIAIEVDAQTYTAADNNKIWKVNYNSNKWVYTKGAITIELTLRSLQKYY